jgi:magnesium transporter
MPAFGASDPGSNPGGTTIFVTNQHDIYRGTPCRPSMIRSYVTSGGRAVPADGIGTGRWIRLTQPTEEEISEVAKRLNVDVTDVSASMDREEGSRVEANENGLMLIIDIPVDIGGPTTSTYNTLPFAIIETPQCLVTVCRIDSPVIDRFAAGVGLDLSDMKTFALKMLYVVSTEYQQMLRSINNHRMDIEKNLNKSNTENSDIIELHILESSLVYFTTSLRACNVVLDKLRRYEEDKLDKAHLDLLHDVIIENAQAIEMATTYREIISGTRDLFEAVANNKLNYVIKWLTAVTIVLAIPTIMVGLYGMNVELPGANSPYAFWFIILGTVMICAGLWYMLKRTKKI